MPNEFIFFLQILVILAGIWGALKLGKEALIALCVLFAILANLFVLKQMRLFGWNVTCSDGFAIGSIFGLNLLQQGFGQGIAKKTVWISFFAMTFFVVISQIHLFFEPSNLDTSQAHFMGLLEYSPRLLIASILTFFIVQQLDVRIYGFLRKNWLSLLISQAIDTILFSFLGLYGVVGELGSIILVSFLIKCIVIGFMTLTSPILKKHEV